MLKINRGAVVETIRGGVLKVFCVAEKRIDICFEFVCEIVHLSFVKSGCGEERFGLEPFVRCFG